MSREIPENLISAERMRLISKINEKVKRKNEEIIEHWLIKIEEEAKKGNCSCVVSFPLFAFDDSYDKNIIIETFEKLGYLVMPRPNDGSKRIIKW